MSVFILLSGTIFRAPEQKTSKSGRPFVVTTMKVLDGQAAQWWRVFTFSESGQAEFLRLGADDAVSVQGCPKFELFEKDGEQRLSLTLTAHSVVALRQPPKEHKPRQAPAAASNTAARREPAPQQRAPAFNDDVPF